MRRTWILRFIVLGTAAYELRSLLAAGEHHLTAILAGRHLTRGGVGSPWLVALASLTAALLLYELSRGLPAVRREVRWSLRFGGLWLGISSTLLLLIAGVGAIGSGAHLVHLIASGSGSGSGWATAPVVLGLGLLAAALLEGGRWAAGALSRARLCRSRIWTRERPPGQFAGVWLVAGPAPLLAGWSDRGPPARR